MQTSEYPATMVGRMQGGTPEYEAGVQTTEL